MALTVKEVEKAKPGRHSDGKGLYLLVKPKPDQPEKAGAKSWVLRVQYRGRRRDFGLGAFASESFSSDYGRFPLVHRKAITLAEARDKARIGRELAKSGISPSEEWRREELVIPTFEKAARDYHAQIEKAWRNGKHGAQWLSTLEAHAFPRIGDKLVNEIDATAIEAVLLPIWLSIPETARRVRQRVAAVLDYAKARGWRETEAPMRAVAQIMKAIKQPKGRNFEAMPWADVPEFMAKLRDAPASVGRLALQFLILTAARSGEVRNVKWGEVDLEAAEWKIPPEKMKAGKLHIVPLVPAAVDILKEMQGLFGGKASEPIFPGLKGKPMSDATLAKALRVTGGSSYTVHGFRSSFRDWAAETGFADAWAEAALAHGNPDKTEAAYKRTTFFAQRREKLMPAWERFVLSDASNVVALVANG